MSSTEDYLLGMTELELPGEEQNETTTSAGGDDEDPPEGGAVKTSYIRIEGVTSDELTEAERDALQTRLANYILADMGLPASDVEVVTDPTYVVEYNR